MHPNVPSGDRWCRFLRASVVLDRMSRERLPSINCCITAAFSPVNSARSGASARDERPADEQVVGDLGLIDHGPESLQLFERGRCRLGASELVFPPPVGVRNPNSCSDQPGTID